MLTIANHYQSGCFSAPPLAAPHSITLPTGEAVLAWVYQDGTVGICGQATGKIEILPNLAAAKNYATRDREGKPPKRVLYEYGGNSVTFSGCVFADAPAHIRDQWCRDNCGNYLLSDDQYIWYYESDGQWDSAPSLEQIAQEFRATIDFYESTDTWEVF